MAEEKGLLDSLLGGVKATAETVAGVRDRFRPAEVAERQQVSSSTPAEQAQPSVGGAQSQLERMAASPLNQSVFMIALAVLIVGVGAVVLLRASE